MLLAGSVLFAGSIVAASGEDDSSGATSTLLLQRVMAGLPRYDENAKKTAAADLNLEVEPETTHLAPMIIRGRRPSPKFDELALLTERALKAAVQQRYGSQFQYWEEKRLRETAKLADYVANLKLTGDKLESAAIRKEIDRLLVGRNSDWVSQGLDKIFNPRNR